MRTGNVNVSQNDGLYYVSYDEMNVYVPSARRRKLNLPHGPFKKTDLPPGTIDCYEIDLPASQTNYDRWLDRFRTAMSKRCPSLVSAHRYPGPFKHAVLENNLFEIVIEDNGWSFAVELIARRRYARPGLQKRHFKSFMRAIRDTLLSEFDTIYARSGSWAVTPVTKDSVSAHENRLDAARIKLDPHAKPTTHVDIRKNKKEEQSGTKDRTQATTA